LFDQHGVERGSRLLAEAHRLIAGLVQLPLDALRFRGRHERSELDGEAGPGRRAAAGLSGWLALRRRRDGRGPFGGGLRTGDDRHGHPQTSGYPRTAHGPLERDRAEGSRARGGLTGGVGRHAVNGNRRRIAAALAVEETAQERAHPLEALLAAVDDRLLAVVVRVVLRVGVARDLRLHVVQDDAPDL